MLAGVIALSGVAGSFGAAVGLGSAYVFGMVAPLFILSLLWERFDWRSSGLFRSRSLTWRIGPVRRTITGTALASGILLAVMGGATLAIGLLSDSMPSPTGWQADLSAQLQHYGSKVTDAGSFLPSWGAVILVLAIVGLLARRAIREMTIAPRKGAPAGRRDADLEASAEEQQPANPEYVA